MPTPIHLRSACPSLLGTGDLAINGTTLATLTAADLMFV